VVAMLERECFLSEILGRWVFIRTNRVGRLWDVAIVETGKLPEVSHFIVERSFGYPALLVPWTKISLISNTEIVVGDGEIETFEIASMEGRILLKDHILDKKILDMDDHEVEVVYDVKLVLQNDKLYASEVDYSRNRLLRRMGLKKLANWVAEHNEDATVSWMYVQPLPDRLGTFSGHVKLNVLKENIRDIPPVDLADILEELDTNQRLAVFNQLEAEHASDTLEEVEPRVQRELIGGIEKKRAAALIDEMSPVQAADVLAALPADSAEELLELMSRENVPRIRQLIDRHDENILLFATQQYIKLPGSTRVNEVMTKYREIARNMDVIMYFYVTEDGDKLRGVVDVRELIAAEPQQTLEEVMADNVITLGPEETLGDAVKTFARYGFNALPITDDEQRILGVVSFRDIRGIRPRL
jgi:magnesium transporter